MGLFDLLDHAGEASGREAIAEVAKKVVPPSLSKAEKKQLYEQKKKKQQREEQRQKEEERRQQQPQKQQYGGEGGEYSGERNYTGGGLGKGRGLGKAGRDNYNVNGGGRGYNNGNRNAQSDYSKPRAPNVKLVSGSVKRKLKKNPKKEDSNDGDASGVIEEEKQEMTLEEYEKTLGKKSLLVPSEPVERKMDPAFEGLKLLEKKKLEDEDRSKLENAQRKAKDAKEGKARKFIGKKKSLVPSGPVEVKMDPAFEGLNPLEKKPVDEDEIKDENDMREAWEISANEGRSPKKNILELFKQANVGNYHVPPLEKKPVDEDEIKLENDKREAWEISANEGRSPKKNIMELLNLADGKHHVPSLPPPRRDSPKSGGYRGGRGDGSYNVRSRDGSSEFRVYNSGRGRGNFQNVDASNGNGASRSDGYQQRLGYQQQGRYSRGRGRGNGPYHQGWNQERPEYQQCGNQERRQGENPERQQGGNQERRQVRNQQGKNPERQQGGNQERQQGGYNGGTGNGGYQQGGGYVRYNSIAPPAPEVNCEVQFPALGAAPAPAPAKAKAPSPSQSQS